MKPLLYPKNTVDFTNNGYGFLPDGISCRVAERTNAKFELTLVYPASGSNFENILLNNIILAPKNQYGTRDDWQPFRIYKHTKVIDGSVTFYAEHITYLLNGYVCFPNSDYIENEGSCASFMSYLTSQAANSAVLSPYSFSFSTDISKSAKWSIERPISIREAMAYAVKIFGGEWEYDGTKCKLCAARGQNRGVTVQYGSNLTSLSADLTDDAYTHIMPYWTDGTESVYLTGLYMSVQAYTSDTQNRAKIVDLSSQFDEKPTEQELYEAALACPEYLIHALPTSSMQASFIDRGQTAEYASMSINDHVELGDTVKCKARNLDLTTSARCNELVFDVYNEHYVTATLGAVKTTITSTISDTQNKRDVTVWVSDKEPKENFITGDYWIKIDSEVNRAAQSLGRYQAGEWKLLCTFGGGGAVTLGYGLKYDVNGAICIDFNPTITIQNAILLQQESE